MANTATVETKPTFAPMGKQFQESLMQAFLTDKRFAEQTLEVFDVGYFELRYLQFLADRYFKYARKYKDFPTLPLLVSIIRNDLKTSSDILVRDQIIDYLQRMKSNPNPGDMPYVKERALEFARKQALKSAFDKAVDLMETEKYESIVDVVRRAVTVGTVASMGHDLTEDIEARFVESKRDCVATGIPQLDHPKIFDGGLGGGEIGSAIGGTGSGKTHWLVMLGANALRAKKNVLHYTFELSELNTGKRYDSNLCDIDANDIFSRKDDVIKFYEQNKSSLGRLKIKSYPTSTATVLTLRAHIDKLSLSGFKPDLILVDYADIMRSTRHFDELRHELKLIYEELRALAQDLNVAIWTASQSNKEGVNSDVIDETNMSEGYGKSFVADVLVSISRKPIEKSSGRARLFIAKNRAGKDGLLYPITIDTARSKFEISGDQITSDAALKQDESETKAALRKKWEQLQKDESIRLTAVTAKQLPQPQDDAKKEQ